jgi:hypothetical protein
MLFATLLLSKEREFSPIPLPSTEILKRDNIECNEECLRDHLLNGEIFTFLSLADREVHDFAIKEQKLFLDSLFNINRHKNLTEIAIALLVPDKIIGRYSTSISKSVFSYLLTRQHPFRVKSFYIDKEDKESILGAIQEISKERFKFIIAPMTESGAKILTELSPQTYIYFPTIHKSSIETDSEYILFGGIDYENQVSELIRFLRDRSRLALFYDDSPKGKELHSLVLSELEKAEKKMRITAKVKVRRDRASFADLYKDNNRTVGQSFFLNTTKVKSSIILAQLTAFEQNPSLILSTQINYSPILLSMTQSKDRENMLIANSISRKDSRNIVDTNALLYNDIRYDWINYSTTLGVDYFFSIITGQDRLYDELFADGQVLYSVRIMKPLVAKFIEVERVKDVYKEDKK